MIFLGSTGALLSVGQLSPPVFSTLTPHEGWPFLVWLRGRGIVTGRLFVSPKTVLSCCFPPVSGSFLTCVCCSVLCWRLTGTLQMSAFSFCAGLLSGALLWEAGLPWIFWTVHYFLLPVLLPGNVLEVVVWVVMGLTLFIFRISQSTVLCCLMLSVLKAIISCSLSSGLGCFGLQGEVSYCYSILFQNTSFSKSISVTLFDFFFLFIMHS